VLERTERRGGLAVALHRAAAFHGFAAAGGAEPECWRRAAAPRPAAIRRRFRPRRRCGSGRTRRSR
jgi:hypothetical protein